MKVGSYDLIKSLGKGGMGEVFLAYDSVCERHVALKQIKTELASHKTIQTRFLREAKIAATLSHPSIIPIFTIHEGPPAYYTMPYVEGETLKTLIQDKKEIAPLIRIFLNVCQAIAYAHSKKIVHRDLKPENIIVGRFGEVLILDWGLAEPLGSPEEPLEDIETSPGLTRPGKVVGTLSYLSPERALGEPATEQADLYSLGVILYQLLTFQLPYKRTDLKSFQKMAAFEQLIDPIEIAPDREIPRQLAGIAKKALSIKKEDRFSSVAEMVEEIESYIEGRPQWLKVADLDIDNPKEWQFQENVLLAKHIAITRQAEVMEWVNLMISKKGFTGNTKIEATVSLQEKGDGIGFLLSVPDHREGLMDGFCIWLGSQKHPGCIIFRSNIEVMRQKDVCLHPERPNHVVIEKSDTHLKIFIDGELKCHYLSHTPLIGSHVGIVSHDAEFSLKKFEVYIGSQNVQVSCLAVPDAFLAAKLYSQALREYRRIAASFPGRIEEREALFRAGVTLLEEASLEKKSRVKARYLSLALEEFGKLRNTSGAPLEYLGKSLVYKAIGDIDEEVKCLELALRKYSTHPIKARLIDHIIFRLHESSTHDRKAAYHLALLALRQLPHIFSNPDNQKLIDNLKSAWDPLPFILSGSTQVSLAFLLAKPITLMEIIESGESVSDALFALLELGCTSMIKESPFIQNDPDIAEILLHHKSSSARGTAYLFFQAIDNTEKKWPPLNDETLQLFGALWNGRLDLAGEILDQIPLEAKTSEYSPIFPLFGIYLFATEGKPIAMAHLSGITETPYPRIPSLLSHYLSGKIHPKSSWWTEKAFYWEKISLLRHLMLLYKCLKQEKNLQIVTALLKKEKRTPSK